MKVKIENASFATRSFAYSGSFARMVKAVSKHSYDGHPVKGLSLFTWKFIEHFLSENEVSPSKRILMWWDAKKRQKRNSAGLMLSLIHI